MDVLYYLILLVCFLLKLANSYMQQHRSKPTRHTPAFVQMLMRNNILLRFGKIILFY